MDFKKDLFDFFRTAKYGKLPDSLIIGNWEIIPNAPFGFVVKNKSKPEEYHFFSRSDGWVTGKNSHNKKDPALMPMNSLGQCVGSPILVDKENTKDAQTIFDLKLKYKEHGLTPDEMEHLLFLTGVLPKKK